MGKINNKFKADFIFNLGKMMKNGFSLTNCLNCLEVKYKNKNDLISDIKQNLLSGNMFSKSISKLELSNSMEEQLYFAEKNGFLRNALEQVGKLLQSRNTQVKKIRELMAYPVLIMSFLTIMILFIKTFLKFDTEPTKLDFYVQSFDYLILILSILIIVYIGFQVYLIKHTSEYHAAIIKMKLPIIGNIFQKYFEYNLLFSLGLILKSGMTLTDICKMKFSKGTIYQYICNELVANIDKGNNIQDFIGNEKLIADELSTIMDSGFTHEDISEEVILISQMKFDEVLERINKLTNKLQPAIFGVIAIVILITYLRILLPVYTMMEGMF